MKILAVCGMGIGSSMILKMNIDAVLRQLGHSDVEVEHCDITAARGTTADLIVAAKDIAPSIQTTVPVISIQSVMSKDELKTKLAEVLK